MKPIDGRLRVEANAVRTPRDLRCLSRDAQPTKRRAWDEHDARDLLRCEPRLPLVAEGTRTLEVPRREARDAHPIGRAVRADATDERGHHVGLGLLRVDVEDDLRELLERLVERREVRLRAARLFERDVW